MTPTRNLQRKNRLSLNKAVHKKDQHDELLQHHSSRKSDHPTLCRNSNLESLCTDNYDRSNRSPSLISMSSDDCAMENTPPRQRKLTNLDDSLDYENNSFSPSLLMSQAVTIESPEIGWKWDCSSHTTKQSITTTTMKATATMMDAKCSEIDNVTSTPIRLKCNEMRRQLRMKQRKKLQQELRKEQRMQIEKTLQERCAKLQQLIKLNDQISHNDNEDQTLVCSKMLQTTRNNATILNDNCISTSATINYFDDSISDEVLVAATQEVEAQLCMTQDTPCLSASDCKLPIALTTTPSSSSETKKKRSIFSTKFFGDDNDDDDADDWIFQIDEDTFQTKSKTPLQRYKSLPVNSHNINNEKNKVNNNVAKISGKLLKNADETKNTLDSKKLKRHVSTNSLGTSVTKPTTTTTTTLQYKLTEKESSRNRLLFK